MVAAREMKDRRRRKEYIDSVWNFYDGFLMFKYANPL